MNKQTGLINSILSILAVTAITAPQYALKLQQNTKIEPVVIHAIEFKQVDRVAVLEKFLDKFNSPLKENAQTFVEVADTYGLDYKLLPAISCMESTCGKFLLPESYNPFGWGGGYIYFDSYDEAIRNVGKGLDEIYLSRGLDTPEKIAPVYTPPNYTNWLYGVKSFMNQMDEIAKEV